MPPGKENAVSYKQFMMPREIVHGNDALSVLRFHNTKKAFIVTDMEVTKLGHADCVQGMLAGRGLPTARFDGVEPEPTLAVVKKCLSQMNLQLNVSTSGYSKEAKQANSLSWVGSFFTFPVL